ncbi:juvenile hormone epoxide hydrolase-like isoform X2 [Galleria mellonella]|uniref:Epoxide hydrolase n=1 Tax=Galleria mellonella TaxID=7137 RepID=A0ABM3MVN2_GALME|nr:juvenile hormone epoxide hydrolase-like isoform X2 [Galleria mellonella]
MPRRIKSNMIKLITLSSIVAVAAIGSGLITYKLHSVPKKPELNLQKWWGIGEKPKEEDTSIKIFNIDFNDTMIHDLKQRLKNHRPFTKSLEGIQSEYGINTKYLDKIITYWLDKYDFKKRAELLNRYSHYKTRIQGLDIHFIRETPKARGLKVLPLLLLHGWPSSSKEFDKIIPMLTSKRNKYNFVFEVIAADLPGFGFSEGTNKPGLNPVQIGIIMRNLMKRLGFDKFYLQAGDWGSQCATHMVTMFPDEILGFHTNMPFSSRPVSAVKMLLGSLAPDVAVDSRYVDRIYPLKKLFSYLLKESGYFHIQATKPDTIGVALSDSPAGLAAYIVEKMGVVSNRDQLNTPHGGIENLHLDDVLDTITIVWTNNCIVTSSRIYAEAFAWPEVNIIHNIPTPVPTAAINFKYEVLYQPDWILRDKFPNLVSSNTLDLGGHFAALQTPQVLVDDIFSATAKFLDFNAKKNR